MPRPNRPPGTSGKRTADAVSIVPITRDGNLVLIREFRYPLNSWVVGLPAGLVDRPKTSPWRGP